MLKISALTRFLLIGAAVGTLVPFTLSLCLFGTTLQSFVSGAGPTPGYWSGAPTPVPTPVPGPVQTWTRQAFSTGGGAVYILGSMLGAFAGEALALRRNRKEPGANGRAVLGALAGSVVFIGISLCGFLP